MEDIRELLDSFAELFSNLTRLLKTLNSNCLWLASSLFLFLLLSSVNLKVMFLRFSKFSINTAALVLLLGKGTCMLLFPKEFISLSSWSELIPLLSTGSGK